MSILRRPVLAVGLCLYLDSCSLIGTARKADSTGLEPITWGMTLDQVNRVMGPKSQIMTDPKTGSSMASVTFTIAGLELSGFASMDMKTHRVNGVHLLYRNGGLIEKTAFDNLKRAIVKQYGPPSKDLSLSTARNCFWGFPSGSILLISYAETNTISLSYMQTLIAFQIPLQN